MKSPSCATTSPRSRNARPALTLSPVQVAATSMDAENAIYGLNDFRGVIASVVSSCHDMIDENLYGEEAVNVT